MRKAIDAIPVEAGKPILDRVEAAFVRALYDGLIGHFLAKAVEPDMLKALLYEADIGVPDRTRREIGLVFERLAKHGNARHFVVGQTIGQHGP
ncbi:hypothetical protein [Sinorhizobium fredii]|uniref:hypothetical protein n=1 Tax=Rhizobium fredii TaxID=380 RepID=UPI003CE53299